MDSLAAQVPKKVCQSALFSFHPLITFYLQKPSQAVLATDCFAALCWYLLLMLDTVLLFSSPVHFFCHTAYGYKTYWVRVGQYWYEILHIIDIGVILKHVDDCPCAPGLALERKLKRLGTGLFLFQTSCTNRARNCIARCVVFLLDEKRLKKDQLVYILALHLLTSLLWKLFFFRLRRSFWERKV